MKAESFKPYKCSNPAVNITLQVETICQKQGRIFREICLPSFTKKLVVLPKTGQTRPKPSCVWTKKWVKSCERAELAQNRGQIWTQHA